MSSHVLSPSNKAPLKFVAIELQINQKVEIYELLSLVLSSVLLSGSVPEENLTLQFFSAVALILVRSETCT